MTAKKYHYWSTNKGKREKKINSTGEIDKGFRNKELIEFSQGNPKIHTAQMCTLESKRNFSI